MLPLLSAAYEKGGQIDKALAAFRQQVRGRPWAVGGLQALLARHTAPGFAAARKCAAVLFQLVLARHCICPHPYVPVFSVPFHQVESGVPPDLITYSSLITACQRAGEALCLAQHSCGFA